MTLYDSNRPSLDRIRDLAERRGESISRPHDCGITYCGTCPGGPPTDAELGALARGMTHAADEQESPPAGRGRGIRLPERDNSRPPKDPRYAWLPP